MSNILGQVFAQGAPMLYAVLIVGILMALWLLVIHKFHCKQCGSWKSRVEVKRKLEWGTDVGGLLFADPFYLHTKRRICSNCDHVKVIKTWFSPVPTDESVFNQFKEEVLRYDFRKPGEHPPRQ